MKETRALNASSAGSTFHIPIFRRNAGSSLRGQIGMSKPALVSLALLLCFALALYWGVSRTFAEHDSPNHDWLHHGNDLANTRFQGLDQINTTNVKGLQMAWVFHTGVPDPLAELEATPIEVNGRLFVTDGHDNVFALRAATGQMLWKFDGFNDEAQLAAFFLCCGRNNHGVAYGDGKVFVGRLDDSVIALRANTGKVVWSSTLADFKDRVSINSAPQFVHAGGHDLVIISLSGGEFEIRGQVFALDAKTGQIAWRFSTTLPTSFNGNSFQTGGAAVWVPHSDRCGPRAGISERRECRARYSWGKPRWRQFVCRVDRRRGSIYRQSCVAFSGSASRHLGLRQRATGCALPAREGWKALPGLGPLQQEWTVVLRQNSKCV
jgi:PQQ-like domain